MPPPNLPTRSRPLLAAVIDHGTLRLEHRSLPPLQPGQALIQDRLAGICNTDLELLKGYIELFRHTGARIRRSGGGGAGRPPAARRPASRPTSTSAAASAPPAAEPAPATAPNRRTLGIARLGRSLCRIRHLAHGQPARHPRRRFRHGGGVHGAPGRRPGTGGNSST